MAELGFNLAREGRAPLERFDQGRFRRRPRPRLAGPLRAAGHPGAEGQGEGEGDPEKERIEGGGHFRPGPNRDSRRSAARDVGAGMFGRLRGKHSHGISCAGRPQPVCDAAEGEGLRRGAVLTTEAGALLDRGRALVPGV